VNERDDTLTDDDCGILAEGLSDLRPADDRSIAVKARIMQSIQSTPTIDRALGARRITVRTTQRVWEKRPLGLEICVLHEDEHSRAALVRMAPGAFLPSHLHNMDEESLILEGDALIGEDIYLGAGDYHFVRAGEHHPIISSPNGCGVYVHGDRRMPLKPSMSFIKHFAKLLLPWLRRGDADRYNPEKRD
jgi:quercetin dioxygenase-like cupin family protein